MVLFLQKTIGNQIEMNFLYNSNMGFIRWFLSFADYATIVEPIELKENLREIVTKMNTKLDVYNWILVFVRK